jgi:hypothetical protein
MSVSRRERREEEDDIEAVAVCVEQLELRVCSLSSAGEAIASVESCGEHRSANN